jgi:hypothetical protein
MTQIVSIGELKRRRADEIVRHISLADRKKALRALSRTGFEIGSADRAGLSAAEWSDKIDAMFVRQMSVVAETLDRPDLGHLSAWDATLVLTRLFELGAA